MPINVGQQRSNSPSAIIDKGHVYEYEYPGDINLRPDKDDHKRLTSMVMERVRESYSFIQARHSGWNKIDRTLTAYVPLDEAESKVVADDARKPVSIVVPLSYAALDTMLSYWMSAFLEEPIFRYDAQGPEDVIGAKMLEAVINLHSQRMKVALQLYTMWRDSLAYGIGAVVPIWHKVHGKKSVVRERGFMSEVFGGFFGTGYERESVDSVLFEGNKLLNIDPYLILPDPNTPINEIQDSEFFGWIDKTNLVELLDAERYGDGEYFNVKYLKHYDGRNSQFGSNESNREERFNPPSPSNDLLRPIDVVNMYIRIIPKDWKLGEGEYPEKWLFRVAGDGLLISAQPLGLDHGMFPVAVCAPGFDGHTTSPISELEVTYGMQQLVDWLFSSHVHNIRKALHDMFVVDPSIINMHDLNNPAAGKFIRVRRSAWGTQKLDSAIKQFPVSDVTRGNVADAGVMLDLMNRILGTTDAVQGVMRHTSERRSATEARGVHTGAVTRMEKSARIASIMAMKDIGYMFASHTQQFLNNEMYIKTVGLREERLKAEYANKEFVNVKPSDISIDYDVIAKDGSVPSGDFVDSWIQLFSIASSNPEIGSKVDIVRMFKHIARISGAKNVEDFIKKGGQANVSTRPQEQIEQGVQDGNIVSMEDFYG